MLSAMVKMSEVSKDDIHHRRLAEESRRERRCVNLCGGELRRCRCRNAISHFASSARLLLFSA